MSTNKNNKKNKTKKINRKEYIRNVKEQQKKWTIKNKRKTYKKKNNNSTNIKDECLENNDGKIFRTINSLSIASLIFAIIGIIIALFLLIFIVKISDIVNDMGGFENATEAILQYFPDSTAKLNDNVSDINYATGNKFTTVQLAQNMFEAALALLIIFCCIKFLSNFICIFLSILVMGKFQRNKKIMSCSKISIVSIILSFLSFSIVNFILFIIRLVYIKKYYKSGASVASVVEF